MDDSRVARAERFRVVFDEHYGAVRAYALRRCGRADDADDVVAETFTVAWRRLDEMPGEAALPWLYGVARRVLANQRRGERRWLGLVERLRQQPRDVATPAVERTPVLDALRTLRVEDQELLRLSAWEGLSHGEIAAVLGISANAATIRVHRARKRLGEALGVVAEAARKESTGPGQATKHKEVPR